MNRTKIAIVGDDMSAFHLFNKIYRSDDRYEVKCFFTIQPPDNEIVVHNKRSSGGYVSPAENKYPCELAGDLYPLGIFIYNVYPYVPTHLEDMHLEKCIFSPLCVASGKYLHLAAQFMALDCSIISHSLETTCLPPPKAFVSFFSDTQFDIPVLMTILKTFKDRDNRPVIAMAGPLGPNSKMNTKFNENCKPFFLVKDKAEFRKFEHFFSGHKLEVCEELLNNKYKIYFIYDFEQFSAEALRNDLFDMIFFIGFNSLPCYFESHLIIYACDDFTYGEEVSEHPSCVLLQQAHIIIYIHLRSVESSQNIIKYTENRNPTIVHLPVTFCANNQSNYSFKTALLVDDSYPTHHCHCTNSISKYLAESCCNMISYPLEGSKALRIADCPIYSDMTENDWPAIIYPETPDGVEKCFRERVSTIKGYHVIVSSTSKPCLFKPPDQKPVVQFRFNVNTAPLTADLGLFTLPVGAFVKQRKRNGETDSEGTYDGRFDSRTYRKK